MGGGWLARMRWRRRGAWLWPAFVGATAFDGLIGHMLPPAGDSQTVVSAVLVGLFFNLIGVILLSRPGGGLVRRARRDLPSVVARDYAGTIVVVAIAVILLSAGLVHRATVVAHEQTLRDASVRAAAFIGDRAPPTFRANARDTSTLAILAGYLYRVCVPSADHKRTYCVVVNTRLPFARSVTFSGYEPNWIFAKGTG
ncbi:MAG: hypothetical protein ACR2L9_12045 [Solirubrobacteraceae bacterium]